MATMKFDETVKLGLRPREAAAALSISRAKFYQLLAAGAVRSVRIGGVRIVPVEALRELLIERTTND